MKALLSISLLASVLLWTGPAMAEAILASAPLHAGPNGAVCSCANLTTGEIAITIMFRREANSSGCFRILEPDGVERCSSGTPAAGLIHSCQVWREDGKSLNAKQVACVLQSIDGSGNPTAVVPLTKKKR